MCVCPPTSTVYAVLDRHGLVTHARRRHRNKAEGTDLSQALLPNELWCADLEGEFKLGDNRYCYPLTVTDQGSRFLLVCEAFESTSEQGVLDAFHRLLADRGLPQAIRTDTALPFASPNDLFNLSRLSIWWLRLGSAIEGIKPGRPHQNGRHERMHLTLMKEATRPPDRNILQQQARFDAFIHEFNNEQSRKALDIKAPADIYTASTDPIAACRTSNKRSRCRRPSPLSRRRGQRGLPVPYRRRSVRSARVPEQ